MKIIDYKKAFEYAKLNYPEFPSDWCITPHFTWNEAFKNETKEYGLPAIEIFRQLTLVFAKLEDIRVKLNKPINVHCAFRSRKHNEVLKKQGYNPAMHSSHLYGMAIDFDVQGMTMGAVRGFILKEGLKVRIEANTPNWTHIDIGNPYTNNYKWGVFQP